MKKTILIFGALSIAILFLFQLSKFSLFNTQNSNDVFIVISGVLFILVGILVGRFLYSRRNENNSQPIKKIDHSKIGLTKQEHKILLLLADGLSNTEIAQSLFISESTVKTHVSRILGKLNAKRRTEAIKIGRDLQLIH